MDQKEQSMRDTNYRTARVVSGFFQLLGFSLVAIGILVIVQLYNEPPTDEMTFGLAVVVAGGAIISGLLIVMAAQLVKATVETADNTWETVQVLRRIEAGLGRRDPVIADEDRIRV
jgi:hypothetical protein